MEDMQEVGALDIPMHQHESQDKVYSNAKFQPWVARGSQVSPTSENQEVDQSAVPTQGTLGPVQWYDWQQDS